MVSTAHELNDYHVIVSLDGDIRDHIPAAPFHTILLSWNITFYPQDLEGDNTENELEELYKQLAAEIEDLMAALRGEDAD